MLLGGFNFRKLTLFKKKYYETNRAIRSKYMLFLSMLTYIL